MLLTVMPETSVALTIGLFSVRWYGVLYVVGFGLALWLLPHLQKWRDLNLTRGQWVEVVAWAAGGVILGGRLGYVLFYEPTYFIKYPLEVFAIWQGGMSAHGGFIGVALAMCIVNRLLKINMWRLTDVVVVPAALGLALGRLGNFINQELYGTPTSLPWGVRIPGVLGSRHPVQIYALVADLLIALWCYLYLLKNKKPGQVAASFLIMYGVLRFLLEYWREPEWSLNNIAGIMLTRGQLLSLPIILVGAMLWIWRQKATSK